MRMEAAVVKAQKRAEKDAEMQAEEAQMLADLDLSAIEPVPEAESVQMANDGEQQPPVSVSDAVQHLQPPPEHDDQQRMHVDQQNALIDITGQP